MSLWKPIPAAHEERYVFGGFARSNAKVPVDYQVTITAESADGKFLGFVVKEKFTPQNEWSEFKVQTDKLPQETAVLRPSVFSHTKGTAAPEMTAEIFLDDLYFSQIESKSK